MKSKYSPWQLAIAATLAICVPVLAGPDPAGVPNFHIVNDRVFRGGQPTHAGLQSLAALGVHTVLDLREPGQRSTAENNLVTQLGMRYVSVPMKGMATPSEDQISRALAVLNDPQAGPVFVHCKRGADRTGAVIACYRIGHDHLSNKQALSEARGLGMSMFQIQIQSYVTHYQPHPAPTELAGDLPAAAALAAAQP